MELHLGEFLLSLEVLFFAAHLLSGVLEKPLTWNMEKDEKQIKRTKGYQLFENLTHLSGCGS